MTTEPPISLWPDPEALGTVTDLYQITMMAGYAAAGMSRKRAVFELFVRRLPPGRSFLVFAGVEQAIGDILRLAFSREQAEYLRDLPQFRHVAPGFFEELPFFRFRGEIWSVPEGTLVFPGETLVRVEADLDQAQWIETFLIASLNYPTLVASKAARIVASAGRPCFDFGARRGHGPHAGFLAARAAFLAGFEGTSHVEAARRLGIPVVGTMAHAWVQAFGVEETSFAAFAGVFPENSTLLVDTYDTLEGVRHAAAIEPPIQAIRIDSGDIGPLAIAARTILDEADRKEVKILVSGDLDEWKIAALVASGAPIDAFGVGTELITSRDAPALSMVYKLVSLDGQGRVKLSPGKRTYPLAKQVYRSRDNEGKFSGDFVARADEFVPDRGEPLLVPVVREGRLVADLPSLTQIRARCRDQVSSLPEGFVDPDSENAYSVTYSDSLERAATELGL